MSNEELPAGTAVEKTPEAAAPTSSPTIGNTIVGCSLSASQGADTKNLQTFEQVVKDVKKLEVEFNQKLVETLSSCDQKVLIVVPDRASNLNNFDHYNQPVRVVIYKDAVIKTHCQKTYGGST